MYYVFNQQNIAFQEQCRLDGISADECSLTQKLIDDFKSANFFWLFLMMVCFTISNISRSIRWNQLLHTLGYQPKLSNSFFTVMLSYFTNLGISRGGEVIRAATLAKYEHMSNSKVMGTVVVDRIFDMVLFGAFILLALVTGFDTLWNFIETNASEKFGDQAALGTYVLVGLGICFLFAFTLYSIRGRFRNFSIYGKLRIKIKAFMEGMKTYRYVKNKGWFWFHSILIWVCFFLMTYFCFFAFAPTANLSIQAALMVFVFGSLGIIIPTPGGMGTYHALLIAGLGMYQINSSDAFSYANIIFFTIQIFYNIVFGIISLILLPIMNKGYVPKHKLAPEQESMDIQELAQN